MNDSRNSNDRIPIAPYFINYRQCFSIFGSQALSLFEKLRRTENDGQNNKLINNHIITEIALAFCQSRKIPSLAEALQKPVEGLIFCSTELFEGTEGEAVFEKPRIRNKVLLPFSCEYNVYMDLSVEHFTAYTGKHEQTKKSRIGIIGQVRSVGTDEIIIYPLILGVPNYDQPVYKSSEDVENAMYAWIYDSFKCLGYSNFEIFAEDIDEFAKCKNISKVAPSEWMEQMKRISENDVKSNLASILKEQPKSDWGGEINDHFSSNIHINGCRHTAAFLLKGPTNFREMTPDILGKRGDQIYRLSQSSAQILVVQHSHYIGDAVRATLRAFAVAPHQQRLYCCIDGHDTYRILRAYGKL